MSIGRIVGELPTNRTLTLERSALRGTGKPQTTERTMLATEKARLRMSRTTGLGYVRETSTIDPSEDCYFASLQPDQTFSYYPIGWTEEPFELAEPYTDQELWEAEGCPTHVMVGGTVSAEFDEESRSMHIEYTDGVLCEVDGHEQPETLPDDQPGVPDPPAHPARHSVRSEVADGIVLTGYAQCTFDEFPDLTPDDREDIRQELATGLCVMADRAIASGRTPRIRRDILRLTRDRLVSRKRKESAALPCVAVADEHAAAEARERLETERMTRQANAWRLHLVEMERLNQMQPAMTGTRLL